MTIPNIQPELDEISRQILIFFRGGPHFSVHDTAKAIGQPMERVWKRFTLLEKQELIEIDLDGYKISKKGSDLLLKLGYNIPKPPEGKKNKKILDSYKINPFGTIIEGFMWIIIPIILVGIGFLEHLLMLVGRINTLWYWGIVVLLSLLLVMYVIFSFRKVPEYENLVIFRLGKCIGKRGPGPVLIIPILDKPLSVDLRVKHQEVPHETCITQDNVQLDVDFVFYWKIQEPIWSITKVTDPEESIRLLATALLRAVIAHFRFNDVLNQRESINDLLREKIDEISADWGVYVTTMEIREIKPPDEIVKSMHKQVSAEWQRKATIIEAEGTAEALRMLNEVASSMDEKTKSLKYYETLQKIGDGQATKYIVPMELTNLANKLVDSRSAQESGGIGNGASNTELPSASDNLVNG